MSVVRSLLISIGFKSDNSGVKKTEKNIIGMTGRIAASFTILKFFAKRVVGFFSEIADAIINSSFLAKRLGVSLKEISGIEKAGLDFGLDKKQIQSSLSLVSDLLTNFRNGTNDELAKIARGIKFEISAQDNALDVFLNILKALSKINSETDRIAKADLIFGKSLGVQISMLANDVDRFEKLVNENRLSNEFVESEKQAEDFKRSLDKLSVAFDNFSNILSFTIFPLLTEIFKSLTFVAETFRALLNPNLKNLSNIGQRFADSSIVGQGFQSVGEGFRSGLFDVNDKFNEINPQVTVTNTINVPQGTTSEMAQSMLSQFVDTVDAGINKVFRQIELNNPLVE